MLVNLANIDANFKTRRSSSQITSVQVAECDFEASASFRAWEISITLIVDREPYQLTGSLIVWQRQNEPAVIIIIIKLLLLLLTYYLYYYYSYISNLLVLVSKRLFIFLLLIHQKNKPRPPSTLISAKLNTLHQMKTNVHLTPNPERADKQRRENIGMTLELFS